MQQLRKQFRQKLLINILLSRKNPSRFLFFQEQIIKYGERLLKLHLRGNKNEKHSGHDSGIYCEYG